MFDPDTITVQLHNGTTYSYPTSMSPQEVVDDLIDKGVTKRDIKATIHVVPRLPHSMAYKMED